MKKLHYKKEDSKDKTPIVLRLERRHTMDASEDKVPDERRKLSARAASIGGLDMLTDGPSRPRDRAREVTKCFSEDVLSKGQSKVPRKIITEAELSTSWLYKTMQESVNARFKSPIKPPIPNISQTSDLTPVLLQDPKMKPIPVKSSRYTRSSSCICQFATVMSICLCTVGFLAAVAGIIYMEVFANKNLTSYETPEKETDLSELTVESHEGHNELTPSDFPIGKEQNFQKSPGIKLDTKEEDDPLKKTEDHRGTNIRILNTKTPVSELNQYFNSENTKIKFQDGETVIYEVKPSNFMEYEESSNSLGDFKGRNLVNFSETEDNSVDEKGSKQISEKLDEKLGNLEIFSDSQIHKMLDEESEDDSDAKPQDSIPKEGKFEGNSREIVSKEVKHSVLETLTESDKLDAKLKFPDPSEIEHGNNSIDIGPKVDLSQESSEFHGENKIQSINVIEGNDDQFSDSNNKSQLQHEGKILPSVQYVDKDEFSNSNQKSQFQHEVKILPSVEYEQDEFNKQKSQLHHEVLPSVQYVDQDENEEVMTDHDVNSMIMVVDDSEEEELDDSFISNRNGEVIPFETATSKFTASATSMKPDDKTFVTEANGLQSATQKQFIVQPVLSKRPMDMRVQLSEAMKHLQVLDTNNRILMSRKKTVKPNVNMKKRKQSSITRKEEEAALEKMKYLQKVRLLMYDQLQ